MTSPPTPAYEPTASQLVLELFVRDIERAKSFYVALGFKLVDQRGTFVELSWEGHFLFLDQELDLNLPPPEYHPQANVRIMVPDVDACWERAQKLGCKVLSPIKDQFYGLRDFTIVDPDGFGVRFATRLQSAVH